MVENYRDNRIYDHAITVRSKFNTAQHYLKHTREVVQVNPRGRSPRGLLVQLLEGISGYTLLTMVYLACSHSNCFMMIAANK